MATIKRYPNRKLYDTESKRYISLSGVAEMLRAGEEVQVIDHVSGEDLTNLTLIQIILEEEKKRSGVLPQTLLTRLIRSIGDRLAEDALALWASSTKLYDLPRLDELIENSLSRHGIASRSEFQMLTDQIEQVSAKLAEALNENSSS